jgi:hypothetical protein
MSKSVITVELHRYPVPKEDHGVGELHKLVSLFPQAAVDWLRLKTPIRCHVKDLDFKVSLSAEGLLVAVESHPSLYLFLASVHGRTFSTEWVSADLTMYQQAILAINRVWQPPAVELSLVTSSDVVLELPPELPPEKKITGTLKPKKGYRRMPSAEPAKVEALVKSLNRKYGHDLNE